MRSNPAIMSPGTLRTGGRRDRTFASRARRIVGGGLCALAMLAPLAATSGAEGSTARADEVRVARIVRLTPPELEYRETHASMVPAFNQAGDKVLLWGQKGAEVISVEAATRWTTREEFQAALRVVPSFGRTHTPVWSALAGERDILYLVNTTRGEVMRFDSGTGASSVVAVLPGNPRFGENFFLPGFSRDGKLVIWEDPDDPDTRGWSVDVGSGSVVAIPRKPVEWSADWIRLPFVTHGHEARSPDGRAVIATSARDARGYAAYLRRPGERSQGLLAAPGMNHVTWRGSNDWAVFDDVETGSLHQIWMDGTTSRLLDLRPSKVPLTSGGYYRESSFPNLSADGRKILYSSDGGNRTGNIGIFIAFLENANPPGSAVIERFDAVPSVVAPGSSAELAWAIRDAQSRVLLPAGGALPPIGRSMITPESTTVLELVGEGESATVRRRIRVEVAAPSSQNFLPNGSMESGLIGSVPDGWRASGSAQVSRDHAYDYANSVRVGSKAASRSQGKIMASVPPHRLEEAAGKRVRLSAWLRSASGFPVRPDSLQVHTGNPAGSFVVPVELVVGNSWKRVSMTADLPRDLAGQLSVAIAAVGGWEDSAMFVDRVSLEVEPMETRPQIERFDVDWGGAGDDGVVTLRWKVANATMLTVSPIGLVLEPAEEGVVILGGDIPAPARGTALRLVAQGPGGATTADPDASGALPAPAGALPPSAPSVSR